MEHIVPKIDDGLLDALLDSWDRNNTILLNLLRAFPEDALEAKAMEGSPSIAVQLSHMHSTRLFFINQTAPEFGKDLTQLFRQEGENRLAERNLERIAEGLEASAKAVRDAVQHRLETGREMKGKNVAYDHPILLLQHLLWHEGYHVGQMMLGLKAMGQPMTEEQTEPAIWGVWRREEWTE
jgi:uncharacterized damage-inducible protein DinB